MIDFVEVMLSSWSLFIEFLCRIFLDKRVMTFYICDMHFNENV